MFVTLVYPEALGVFFLDGFLAGSSLDEGFLGFGLHVSFV